MRKLIIFFIVTIFAITIYIMNTSNKSGRTVTKSELESHRKTLIEYYERNNKSYTENDINRQVEEYRDEIENGMTFKRAFIQALKISSVIFGILAFIIFIKGSYYNELLTSNIWSQGHLMTRKGRIEYNNVRAKSGFLGKWFK